MPEVVGLSLQQLALIFAAGLAVSAAFSMLEAALLSQDRHRLRHLAGRGVSAAKKMLLLLSRSDRLLAAILLCNNLANVMCATAASVLVARLSGGDETAVFAATLVVTFVILVCSEIAPKVVGVRHAQRLSLFFAAPVLWLVRGLQPAVRFALFFASALLRIFGMRAESIAAGDAMMSSQELRSVVLASSGRISPTHRKMLLRMLAVNETRIEEIMTPRRDIHGVNLDANDSDIAAEFLRAEHSHLPVYSGNLDAAEGFARAADILKVVREKRVGAKQVRARMRKAAFVPAAGTLLQQLQKPDFAEAGRRALVVDGHGRVVGMVAGADFAATLTDSAPPRRAAKPLLIRDPDGGYATEGAASLRDLAETAGLTFPQTSARTLNGLVLEHLGDIPEAPACLQIGDARIILMEVRGDNIARARLEKIAPPPEDPDEEEPEPEAG